MQIMQERTDEMGHSEDWDIQRMFIYSLNFRLQMDIVLSITNNTERISSETVEAIK